jgi:hypothetical protein
MAIKHTEFMKLTQGNKSLNEYLQAFNNLPRYAPKFVDTNAKKIASFKRGLSPKLMKSMGNSKCITFNEFISDALTQENNDKIYATSKTHKRNFEAGASQSKALVVSKTQYCPPTANVRYHPPQKKNQAKTSFRKGYIVSLLKNTSGQGSSNVSPSNRLCWNCNKLGHWANSCPYPPKQNSLGNVCQGRVHYTTVEEIPASEVVTAGKFLINDHHVVVLFDSGASHSFVSSTFASK